MKSRQSGVISGSDPECPSPITPNDLILGRAASESPQGPFDPFESKSTTKKFRFLQNLMPQWWNDTNLSFTQSFHVSSKWLQHH